MSEEPEPITPVIFLRQAPGEVLAVFPQEVGTYSAATCSCYALVGQHGACDVWQVRDWKRATPAEYAELKRELESEPYNYRLKVRRKFTQHDQEVREQQLREMSKGAD